MDSYTESVMLHAVLPNMKLVAEASGKQKANKVLQVTVGGKKKRNGMYLQMKNGEVLTRHGIYEGKPDCRLHFISSKNLSKYCMHLKGGPVVAGFYNPITVLYFNSLIRKTIKLQLSRINNEEEKSTAAKMCFFSIFSAINELGKSGNETISKWLKDSPKKTYSLEIRDNDELKIWLTAQNGSSKVLLNQSTILTSQCSIKFDNTDEAVQFFNAGNEDRSAMIEKYASVREAPERESEINIVKEIVEEAFKYLK